MGDLWRSEDMELLQFTIPRESLHDAIENLGTSGVVEFKDVRIFFAKSFLSNIPD